MQICKDRGRKKKLWRQLEIHASAKSQEKKGEKKDGNPFPGSEGHLTYFGWISICRSELFGHASQKKVGENV